uniref:Uncharacterized protein n=1 Tax=Cucumis melo TaxID=3656 RepID=A0A9I9DGC7_CUCME
MTNQQTDAGRRSDGSARRLGVLNEQGLKLAPLGLGNRTSAANYWASLTGGRAAKLRQRR